jgi:hypothetical protein
MSDCRWKCSYILASLQTATKQIYPIPQALHHFDSIQPFFLLFLCIFYDDLMYIVVIVAAVADFVHNK